MGGPRLGDRDQPPANQHFGRQAGLAIKAPVAVRAQRLRRAVMAGGREHRESVALRLPSLRP